MGIRPLGIGEGIIRLRRGIAVPARGIALIAVLWVVLLLTVIATAIAVRSATGGAVAARIAQAAQVDVDADGAIRLTLLSLVANARTQDRPVPVRDSMSLDGSAVSLDISNEASRLDLNSADENLLFAYFKALRWEDSAARQMVSRIRDWQDADDVPREGGMERDGYASAGLPQHPRNGPMESVQELRMVGGASGLPDASLAGLTVYTHQAVSSDSSEEPLVATALKVADELKLGGRSWSTAGADAQAQRLLAGSVVRVRACAERTNSRRCREVVVRLTGSVTEPVQIFLWRSVVDLAQPSS